MTTKTYISTLLFSLILINKTSAQNINGFTIFASTKARISINFYSSVTNYEFVEKSGPSTYSVRKLTDKMVSIDAKKETTDTFTLRIIEGKRMHKFYIVYKNIIQDDEIDRDYSDLKKLANLIKQHETASPPKTSVQTNNPSQNTQANTSTSAQKVSFDSSYIVLQDGDNAMKNQQYDVAKFKYEQALKINPNSGYAKAQLEEAKKKIEEIENQRQQQIDNNYNSIITNANNAYRDNKLEEAKTLYTQTLALKPDEVWPKGQIKAIEEKQKIADEEAQKQKISSLYNSYILSGDKNLNEKNYDAARMAYNQALTVKPNDPVAQNKLKEVDKRISDEKIASENQKKEASYQSFMTMGNDALSKLLYDNAKNAYAEALKIKPTDPEATKQLNKIKVALAAQAEKERQERLNKELEEKYNTAISLANNAFNAGIYDLAKEQYKKALQLKENESYPQKKIAEINNILSNQAIEKNKQIKDSLNTANYNAAIDKGENALATKDYKNAKTAFQFAHSLKPGEEYPPEKINEISSTLNQIEAQKKAEAEQKEKQVIIDKQYNFSIEQGNKALQANQYDIAKKAFTEASELKPDEELPKSKLQEINDKLAEIEKEKENEEKYETYVEMADSLGAIINDYAEAIKWYKEALVLKPNETYPQKQVSYFQGEIAKKDSIVAEQKIEMDRKQRFQEGMDAYKSAIAATKELRYEDALTCYKKFLSTIDTVAFNENQYNQAGLLRTAKDKIKDIEAYLERTKSNNAAKKDSLSKPDLTPDTISGKASSKNSIISKDTSVRTLYYPSQKDIESNEIYAKYPDIDFNKPPATQVFNSFALDYSHENNLINNQIISESPRLDLTNSSGNLKIICQSIIFKDTNVYFRFLLRNDDTSEFLVGDMLLSCNRNGNSIKFFPGYISAFPVILPSKEKVIVYETSAIDISDSEKLNFEINDRINKRKLTIQLPGAIYNQEKLRRL